MRSGKRLPGSSAASGTPGVSRRQALALGAGGAALLLASGGLATTRSADPRAAATNTTAEAGAFSQATAGGVLANRSRAVRDGDRPAFLATVSAAPAAFQEAQALLYDNLRKLPLDGWQERVATTQPAGNGSDTAVVRVELRYKLRDFDRGDVSRTRYLTFAPRLGMWTIIGDGSARGLVDDAEIWDGGPLRVVRGRSCLVIGDATGLNALARRLDAAVPVVTGAVGRRWAQRAVALVPADARQAMALAGRGQNLREIAALATVAPDAGGGRGEDRVIISPDTFGRLNELGRDVVLTHELTHVATGGATDGRTPLWLIEGFADYVGYKRAKISVRSAARELHDDVKAGTIPSDLPERDAFSGTSSGLSQAYQQAWLACRLVAERYGEARLLALYKAAGRVPEATALQEVLGIGRSGFVALWREYLKKELR